MAFSVREVNEVLHRLSGSTPPEQWPEKVRGSGGARDTLAEGKISEEVTDTHQCTETQKRHSEGHRDREGTVKKKRARVRTHRCRTAN